MVTTVTSMVLILAEGRGRERQLNVSMVTELKSQSGQTRVDLYMPCRCVEYFCCLQRPGGLRNT